MGADQTSLLEFQRSFPDDAACAAFAFRLRWPDGFLCPKCGGRRAVSLRSRANTYECLDCGRQTSITAGTAMHRSKLPLVTWFWAAHLLSTEGPELSSLRLQRRLGVSYRTAWLMLKKLKRSLHDLDRAPLRGRIECLQIELQRARARRGQGPQEATPIVVAGALETAECSDERGLRPDSPGGRENGAWGRIRLAVLPDGSAAALSAFLQTNLAPEAEVLGDGPAVRRAFALLKRRGLGSGGSRGLRNLQRDLRDLEQRFNFRALGPVSVAAILSLATTQKPATYWEIVGRPKPRIEQPAIRRRVRRRRTALGLRPDRAATTRES